MERNRFEERLRDAAETRIAELREGMALAQVERNLGAEERALMGLPPRKEADDGE